MSTAEMTSAETADPARIASALLGGRPVVAVRCRKSGNNQVFRIETDSGPFALKLYGGDRDDASSRLEAETAALRFLSETGCAGAVPRLHAVAPNARAALHEWIDGERSPAIGPDAIQQVAAFVRHLHDGRNQAPAQALREAKEACLSMAALTHQVQRRLDRLRQIDHRGLASFLDDAFTPLWRAVVATTPSGALLPRDRQSLSPSDFGFHNALRRTDGQIVFLDFEYFGWDDPAKMVSDFLWHPGMALDAPAGAAFRTMVTAIYGCDADFVPRLAARLPYYGLRWCLIVLNEFLPEAWQRRQLAGETSPWHGVAERQLAKAYALHERVRHMIEGVGP